MARFEASETPTQRFIDTLEFSAGVRNWGYQLRFGLFAISDRDMDVIASAIQARVATWHGPAR